LEGNIRRDGSSQFGLNSRWGTFPSVSGAWRLSKESFFPKTAINDMKLRLSYGEVGNNKIGDFSFIAPLKTVLYSMSGNDNQYNTGTVIAYMANPNLKWETSKQTNFGVDISLLDSRLTLAADYFVTNVEDMLLGLQIPAFTGISFSDAEIKTGTVTSNVGSLTNKGFEFEASYKGKIGQVAYSVNGNLTTFHNEVTNIGNNEEILGQMYKGQNISRTIVGGSLGEFYGYVADGIFQTQSEVDAANALDGDSSTAYQNAKTAPGDYKFKDLDGDNKITADDRTTIGSPIPDFTYGLGINLEYKDFTFSTLLVGSQGNDVFFASRTDLESSSQRNYNKSRVMLDAWNGAGSSNTVARIISSDPNQNSRISSKFVEDGSYLRVRNIQLGYNIPARLTNKIKASKAQVYISGQNLFTFTKYSGFDPEVGNLNGSNLNAGIDTDLYPQAQSIHIGASITF
jgi:TonB-linked SusC/RagA family outer membrane protein